jgi:putative membrane protein
MKQFSFLQWSFLMAHVGAMTFGLAGLVLVLPHPEFVLSLPEVGQRLFAFSMQGGGMVYILLGAFTMGIYGYSVLGRSALFRFMIPAIVLSLGSELLGTSTGFPFGHYAYLNGLGYKIAGLVPFTIPLSWFYLGFAAYLLAYAGLSPLLRRRGGREGLIKAVAIGVGAILLTAWDLVLDPAMSQAPFPFWEFQELGSFFGMPYRNLAGWVGTGVVFMGVASGLLRQCSFSLTRDQLVVPLLIYLANFLFGAVITLSQLDARFQIPVALGVVLGVLPAIALWYGAPPRSAASKTSAVSPNSADKTRLPLVAFAAGTPPEKGQ